MDVRSKPAGGGQEGVGRHRQRDMPVPAVPAAHFILVQPDFPLGCLETLFDHPAHAGHLH